jgi:hypothetical protein
VCSRSSQLPFSRWAPDAGTRAISYAPHPPRHRTTAPHQPSASLLILELRRRSNFARSPWGRPSRGSAPISTGTAAASLHVVHVLCARPVGPDPPKTAGALGHSARYATPLSWPVVHTLCCAVVLLRRRWSCFCCGTSPARSLNRRIPPLPPGGMTLRQGS